MSNMVLEMQWQRRRAVVTLDRYAASFNKLEECKHMCHVLGLFQVAEEDDTQPYFICELDNGQNIYADPKAVRFIDTDEEGNIV